MEGEYQIQVDMMGNGHLYNLREDPFGLVNLWEEAASGEIKSEMLVELAASMLRAADPLPAPHNRYRTKVHPKGYWKQEFSSPDPGVRSMEYIGKHHIMG